MNTLKFGNGEWYGKKDTILAYNDENSNYKPLPFDFSRASSATVINKDGLIETVGSGEPRVDYKDDSKGALKLEPSRTNLITQSEAFGNTYWTKSGATIQGDPSTAGSELIVNGDFATDSDWTISGGNTEILNGKLNFDNVGNYSTSISNSATVVSGKTYLVEYTISNYVSGSSQMRLGSQFGVSRNSNGTFSEYIVANSTLIRLYPSSDNTTLSIDNVSVKEVQGFTSPDGTNNSYKLVEGTNNGIHYLTRVLSNPFGIGGSYVYSIFVNKNDITNIGFRETSQTGDYACVNLSTQTVLDSSNITVNFEDYNNSFVRLSFSGVSGGNGNVSTAIYLLSDSYSSGDPTSGSNQFTGDGTSGVYIYGAQVEAGSYSSSLINTQGSAVTRLQDECEQTVPDGVIGQTEGVVYCEVDVNSGYDTNNLMVTLSDGTNLKQIYINRSNGKLEFFVGTNVNELLYVSPSILTNGVHKLALAYKQNDFAVAIDGVIAHTDNSGNVPTCNKINVGSHYNGNLPFNDRINDVRLYNTRLSDAELIALTS